MKTQNIFVLIAACFFVVFFAYCFNKERSLSAVVLSNQSAESIKEVEITVCGNSLHFYNIPSGSEVGASYYINGESGYKVDVIFSSGKKVSDEVGYVTEGFKFSDKIIVTGDIIKIIGGEVK